MRRQQDKKDLLYNERSSHKSIVLKIFFGNAYDLESGLRPSWGKQNSNLDASVKHSQKCIWQSETSDGRHELQSSGGLQRSESAPARVLVSDWSLHLCLHQLHFGGAVHGDVLPGAANDTKQV